MINRPFDDKPIARNHGREQLRQVLCAEAAQVRDISREVRRHEPIRASGQDVARNPAQPVTFGDALRAPVELEGVRHDEVENDARDLLDRAGIDPQCRADVGVAGHVQDQGKTASDARKLAKERLQAAA